MVRRIPLRADDEPADRIRASIQSASGKLQILGNASCSQPSCLRKLTRLAPLDCLAYPVLAVATGEVITRCTGCRERTRLHGAPHEQLAGAARRGAVIDRHDGVVAKTTQLVDVRM